MDHFSLFMMNLLGWPMTPDPTPVSQHHSSVPVDDDGTSTKPHTHNRSDDCYVPSNGPLDDPCLRHVDIGSVYAATTVSDKVAPPSHLLHDYPGRLEVGPAASPSQFSLPVDGGDQLPTESSSAYTLDSLHYPPLLRRSGPGRPYYLTTSPPAPSPEIHVNTHTALEPTPLQFDRLPIPTRDSSWTYNPNEMGAFSPSTLAYGSMRDNYAATTSLGMRSMISMSSRQTQVATHSGIYPNRPSNHNGSIPFSDQGDRLASSDFDFRSARQRRRCTTAAVPPMASSRPLLPRRASKEQWCRECDICFAQRQVFRRHLKDMHSPRQLCPLCDFKCSPGLKYILRNHFEEKHRGVALPEFLQRQGPVRCSRRRG